MNIYEFDQVVCVSSLNEGAWEADTLVRIFSLYHKQLVRQALRTNSATYALTNDLRSLSRVTLGDWTPIAFAGLDIKRLEWYEDSSDINVQLLPIELGDLFKIENQPDSVYVLVGQPCDLMVRKDGKRFDTVGILLEVRPYEASKPAEFGYILEFYESNQNWRVDLHSASHVHLSILDLCALRTDGGAEFDLNAPSPSNLSLAWMSRAKVLRKEVKEIVKRYNLLCSKKLTEEEASEIAASGNVVGSLVTGRVVGSGVHYNISRIGRLRQPRAGALLSKFANSIARDAFDHDVTKKRISVKSDSKSPEDAGVRAPVPAHGAAMPGIPPHMSRAMASVSTLYVLAASRRTVAGPDREAASRMLAPLAVGRAYSRPRDGSTRRTRST